MFEYDESGRQALKKWADATFRDKFTGTSHHIGITSLILRHLIQQLVWSIQKMNMKLKMSGLLCKCFIGIHIKELMEHGF